MRKCDSDIIWETPKTSDICFAISPSSPRSVRSVCVENFSNGSWGALRQRLSSGSDSEDSDDEFLPPALYNLTISDPCMENVTAPSRRSSHNSPLSSCPNISSLSLPHVKTLGDCAVMACPNLLHVNLPSLEVLGVSTFCNSRSLEIAHVPKVTHVSQCAFKGCHNLRDVTISHNATVSHEAFKDCFVLEVLAATEGFITPCASTASNHTKAIVDYLKWRAHKDMQKEVRLTVFALMKLCQEERAFVDERNADEKERGVMKFLCFSACDDLVRKILEFKLGEKATKTVNRRKLGLKELRESAKEFGLIRSANRDFWNM